MVRKTPLLAFALLSAAACNDTMLVDAPVETCADTTASAATAAPRVARVARNQSTGAVASAAADPGTANALLEAMDVDPSNAVSVQLTGHPFATAALSQLGAVSPVEGSSFAWLSTGIAGAGTAEAVAPAENGVQEGTNLNAPGCGGESTHDCVKLAYSFVVPDDMNSISFDFMFFSAEYPEYVNQGYNDTFTVSLQSPSHNFANISFDEYQRPIGIDSAFFDEPCNELLGTGFEIGASAGMCDAGGTGRLTTVAPVAPGETVTLTFTLMDSGDGIYDSAVMIDNLNASAEAIEEPETEPEDPQEPEEDPGC